MKKFFVTFLTLCLTLCIGLSLVACGGGETDNGGNNNGGNTPTPPPATYTKITEEQWAEVKQNSPINNVTVNDYNPSNKNGDNKKFIITANKVEADVVGLEAQIFRSNNRTEVNAVAAMFGFYQNINYEDLVFDATNDTYSYNSAIGITSVVGLNINSYTEGFTQFNYSNIVISLTTNSRGKLIIKQISLTKETKSSSNQWNNLGTRIFEYNKFGSTTL